jgi:hypothetical protein
MKTKTNLKPGGIGGPNRRNPKIYFVVGICAVKE